MRAAVALGLGILVVLAGAVVALSAERPRLAGTNNVFDQFPNVEVPRGDEACAIDEPVPGDTGAIRVHAEPAAPMDVRVVHEGETVARGSVEDVADGLIDVPVEPVIATTLDRADVCFTNTGPGRLILWGYGANPNLPQRTEVEGETVEERLRLTYLRPGTETGWEIAGAVAHRMGIGRGDLLAGWAFYGWVLALAGTLAAAALALRRGSRR